MTSTDRGSAGPGVVRRLGSVTLTIPVLAAAIGIDGGPIFQILATEDLGIGATALGIAFGLGIVSVPVQLLAGRMPLRRARANTQTFLIVAALQCWVLALLAGTAPGGRAVWVALAITVVAEIALSVLYATSWQPLLAGSVGPVDRQRLNARWSAVARLVLVASLFVFGAVGGRWRALMLVLIGAAAAAAAGSLRRVPVTVDAEAAPDAAPADAPVERRDARSLPIVFVAASLINVGALPLWLVYLDRVRWPGGNLGLVASVQVLAAVAAMLAWRPTLGGVVRRAVVAAVLVAVATSAVLVLPSTAPGTGGQIGILAITAVASAGSTTVRMAVLEQTHRLVRRADVVRVFTRLDVVASTSLQVGLLAGGLLIAATDATSSWPVAPYELFILVASGLAIVSVAALRRTELPSERRGSGRG